MPPLSKDIPLEKRQIINPAKKLNDVLLKIKMRLYLAFDTASNS